MAKSTVEAMDNPFYFTLSGGAMWENEDAATAQRPTRFQPKEESGRVDLTSPDSVKYYNVRHGRSASMHCLSGHGQSTATSSLNHRRIRPLSSASHRLSSYLIQGTKSRDMLDILIVSCKQSETAELWVTFLVSCFQQICKEEKRPPFKVACVGVDEVEEGGAGSSGSRLQIVIVCPTFMERLGRHPAPSLLTSIIQPATVVAMLLGVTSASLDSHHLSNLLRLEQWRRMVVKNQDTAFVGDFLGVSMDILSRSWQLQQAINQMKCDTDSAHFSLIPKKIKMCQNKVLILLSDPVGTSDKITIFVERNGQKMSISNFKKRNPYTIQFSMPAPYMQTSSLVSVNVERNGKSLGQRLVKCESRFRELEQLLKSHNNPVQFMCQALGLTAGNRETLDNYMTGALQKNIPPNFSVLASNTVAPSQSSEELPTLLHFAARYGLERLSWELLECPGGWQACQMKNSAGKSPAAIAEAAGFSSLAHTINAFVQMTELSSMYSYLKGMSEKTQVLDESNYLLPRPLSDTYCVPPVARPVSFLMPLANLNSAEQSEANSKNANSTAITKQKSHGDIVAAILNSSNGSDTKMITDDNYQVPGAPTPVRLADASLLGSMGCSSAPTTPITEYYRVPPAARPFTPLSVPSSPVHNNFTNYLSINAQENLHARFDMATLEAKHKLNNGMSFSSDHLSSKGLHQINHNMTAKSSPQDELIEIINDFKNNVFTIAEVEKLVDSWRNRNDVQQSFKERQDQLEDMRQEYERIQKKMKDQMKRATPFDRIKKFFSRKPKGGVEGAKTGRSSTDSVCHRPLSSLSLHSSSSSSSTGRISTGSGTSLGDSGTHSDQDESLRRSEDFVFHERLQSVKERSETSAGSSSLGGNEEEAAPANLPIPPKSLHPPTLAEIQSTYVNCQPNPLAKGDISCEAKPEISRQETVVQVHCSDDGRNYVNMKAPVEDEEEDPLQVLEDLLDQTTDRNKMVDSVSNDVTVLDPVTDSEKPLSNPVASIDETAYVEIKAISDVISSDCCHPSEDMVLLEQSESLLKKVAESLIESEPLLSESSNQDYMNLPPFAMQNHMRNKLKNILL